jgi:putative oxidoreductase
MAISVRRNTLARLEGTLYSLLRFVAGAMFACHGMQKILGWFGGSRAATGTQTWVGGIIELVGGTLIALGLLTRPAAFIASGTMAVAYFQYHWRFALTGWKWLPLINKGELAALYCFLFLYIAARGAGIISIDRRRGVG